MASLEATKRQHAQYMTFVYNCDQIWENVHNSHIQFILVIHKIYLKRQIDLKLSVIVEPLFLHYHYDSVWF